MSKFLFCEISFQSSILVYFTFPGQLLLVQLSIMRDGNLLNEKFKTFYKWMHDT